MDTDQRKSFRILAPEGQVQAILRLGRRSVNVRVIDSSAGGFALACREVLPLKLGDILRLRTSAGWHEVCIARQETYSDGLLLGVRRLHDIDDPCEAESARSGWIDYFCLPCFHNSRRDRKAPGILRESALVFAALVGIACLIASYRLTNRQRLALPRAADQVVNNLAVQARKVAAGMQAETSAQTATPSPSPPANGPR